MSENEIKIKTALSKLQEEYNLLKYSSFLPIDYIFNYLKEKCQQNSYIHAICILNANKTFFSCLNYIEQSIKKIALENYIQKNKECNIINNSMHIGIHITKQEFTQLIENYYFLNENILEEQIKDNSNFILNNLIKLKEKSQTDNIKIKSAKAPEQLKLC